MRGTVLLFSFFGVFICTAGSVTAAKESDGCIGTALKKVCMGSDEDRIVGGQCSYPYEAGAKIDVMAYEYKNYKKYYTVYRLGIFDASSIRIEPGCKLRNYANTDLTALLHGFERGCRPGKSFDVFSRTSVIYRSDIPVASNPKMPKGLYLAGPIRTEAQQGKNADYSIIKAELLGRYRGLDVVGIEMIKGHGNGMNSASLVFAESLDSVSSRLGADWSTQPKVHTSDDGSESSSVLVRRGRLTLATCDWST